MLLGGTKIYANCATDNRITLSKGTFQTNQVGGEKYPNPVILPRNEWHLPSKKELSLLTLNWNETPTYHQISIIKLPGNIVSCIQKTAISTSTSAEEIFAIQQSDYWLNHCMPLLEAYLSLFTEANEELVVHPFFVGQPNLETVTQDKYGRYTGLHLDSWEAADTLEARKHSRNRICINLGQEPRYFLVLNLNLEQCFAHSDYKNTAQFGQLKRNEYVHVWEFLHDFPDYPITRIKVEPYEAYIAPTEYMIHDGSTLGSRTLDIHLTFRAHFHARPSFLQRLSQLLQ